MNIRSQVSILIAGIFVILGLAAIMTPLQIPKFFETGLAILVCTAVIHALCVWLADGLPRWMGWILIGAYAVFLAVGLM